MFQVGLGEVIVVLVVALWVLGPDKLPTVARVAGRWLMRAKHLYLTLKQDFNEELHAYSPTTRQQTPPGEKSPDQQSQQPPPV